MTTTVDFYDKTGAITTSMTLTSTYQRQTIVGYSPTISYCLVNSSTAQWIGYDEYLNEIGSGTFTEGVPLMINILNIMYLDVREPGTPKPALPAPTPLGTDAAAQNDDRGMTMRWMDDRTRWSKEKSLDLGHGGVMFPTVRLFRLGIYRSRQWEFVFPANVVQCLVAVEEDAEVLR